MALPLDKLRAGPIGAIGVGIGNFHLPKGGGLYSRDIPGRDGKDPGRRLGGVDQCHLSFHLDGKDFFGWLESFPRFSQGIRGRAFDLLAESFLGFFPRLGSVVPGPIPNRDGAGTPGPGPKSLRCFNRVFILVQKIKEWLTTQTPREPSKAKDKIPKMMRWFRE